jgi:hypothetical protein
VDFLLREYQLGVEQVEVEPEPLGHEDGQERAEAPVLAHAPRVQLGAREVRLVARKPGGATQARRLVRGSGPFDANDLQASAPRRLRRSPPR